MIEWGEKNGYCRVEDQLARDNAEVNVSSPINYEVDENKGDEICGPTEKTEEEIAQKDAEVSHRAFNRCKQEAGDDKYRHYAEYIGHKTVDDLR